MPALFTKTLETLTADDVKAIAGWPESLTAEFKQDLSTKDGRPDAWLTGGKVGEFARDKLLREVVALANTEGGHLVLGIEEDRSVSPRVAGSVKPLPRCVALAERLSQMAQHIDPPVPLLLVQGVATEGDAGVVLFRVPRSRSAPHRALDKECYVRRGTESVPVSMREIQDMTLAGSRRSERVDDSFATCSLRFEKWLHTADGFGRCSAFRISALPLSGPLNLSRLYGRSDLPSMHNSYAVEIDRKRFQIGYPILPICKRSMVRGVRHVYRDNENPIFIEMYSDGMVNLCFRNELSSYTGCKIFVGWVIACFANVLHISNCLRIMASIPDSEYAIEVEIGSNSSDTVNLFGIQTGSDSVGVGFHNLPLIFPRLSFGAMSECDHLASTLATDLHDAAEDYREAPIELVFVPS